MRRSVCSNRFRSATAPSTRVESIVHEAEYLGQGMHPTHRECSNAALAYG